MVESYKERFGKPYKRKLIKDDKLNRVDIYDAMAHITKPENVTSFRSAFESLLDYMIKDDWQNDKRYFDPFFQEWWEKEILGIFNFDAHFVEMRQQRQKEYEDAKNGLEAMCEIDAPEESNRQVLVDYIASQMDGHTIFKVSYLEELNCDERVIKYLATRHWSDFRDHKSTFYTDDANLNPVPFIDGIYGARYLDFICDYFEIKYEPAMGRGTNAHRQMSAIYNYFDTETIR